MHHQRSCCIALAAAVVFMAGCTQPSNTAPANEQPATADVPATPAATPAPPTAEADAPVAAQSGTYVIDPAHTLVLAQWDHMGFSEPSANFSGAEGTIVYNAEDVGASSVQVTFPMSGIASFTPEFDEHLRSSDFFAAAQFPSASFTSTRIEPAGVNRFRVTGDLVIKDVTQSITLDATLNGAGEHPMTGKQAIGFSATTDLARSDFGMTMAIPAVSDAVHLRITTEAQMQ